MLDSLPRPIAAYIEAGRALDADAMAGQFAEDAIVADPGDGHAPRGRTQIRAWIEAATIAPRAVFSPETAVETDGQWVLTGPVAGNFPGSPIRLTFRFTLKDSAISHLKIG